MPKLHPQTELLREISLNAIDVLLSSGKALSIRQGCSKIYRRTKEQLTAITLQNVERVYVLLRMLELV